MGMYVARPVKVEAWMILKVETNTPPFNVAVDTGIRLLLENGDVFIAGPGLTARYFPKVGDYLVKQEDGYLYLNPKGVFERKYQPLVVTGETVNVHPPAALST